MCGMTGTYRLESIERQREIYIACEPVHIHVVSIGISWPHQEANMHPKRNQQLAIRAMLNTLIGPPRI
jgi:hypothetical protein